MQYSYLFVVLFLVVSCNKQEVKVSYSEVNTCLPTNNLDVLFSEEEQAIRSSIDSLFTYHLDNDEFVGAGVSILFRDKIIYEKGWGSKDVKSQDQVDKHTIFRIGSLSKSFTGVLCAILIQEGTLSYDEKISTLLEDFKVKDSTFSEQITLGHLLSHTAGFPYHSYTNLVEDGIKLEKILSYFEKIDNLQEPGTQYSYQNAAFAVIGKYLEVKYDKNISILFQEKLFEPLCMNASSSSHLSMLNKNDLALPHKNSKRGWRKTRFNKKYYNAVTAGGINTTTADMSNFLRLLAGQCSDVLDPHHLEQMVTPVIETKVGNRYYKKWPHFDNTFYAYGWRVHTFENSDGNLDTLYHHGGMVNAYRSELAFNRNDQAYIAVMFNAQTPLAKEIIPKIQEIISSKIKSSLPNEESFLPNL